MNAKLNKVLLTDVIQIPKSSHKNNKSCEKVNSISEDEKNIVAPLDNEFVGAPNKEFHGAPPINE